MSQEHFPFELAVAWPCLYIGGWVLAGKSCHGMISNHQCSCPLLAYLCLNYWLTFCITSPGIPVLGGKLWAHFSGGQRGYMSSRDIWTVVKIATKICMSWAKLIYLGWYLLKSLNCFRNMDRLSYGSSKIYSCRIDEFSMGGMPGKFWEYRDWGRPFRST